MATIDDDLKSFNQFVQQHESADLGLRELFDLWLIQNPAGSEYAENVAAINASINDFMNGERGSPAGEHSLQLREEFGMSDE